MAQVQQQPALCLSSAATPPELPPPAQAQQQASSDIAVPPTAPEPGLRGTPGEAQGPGVAVAGSIAVISWEEHEQTVRAGMRGLLLSADAAGAALLL